MSKKESKKKKEYSIRLTLNKVKLAWQFPADPEWDKVPLQWHQAISFGNLEQLIPQKNNLKKIAFLGYPTDEGVKRNHGRPGATLGPEAIRKQMAKLAYHLTNTSLTDFGDINTENVTLEDIQQHTANAVSELLSHGYFPVLLGGGHDVAFAHFKGIVDYLENSHPQKSIGVVNFDAHLDLRKPLKNSHSGTPFYQAADYCENIGRTFNYFCLGLQEAANSPVLLKRAKERNVITQTALDGVYHPHKVADGLQHFIDKVDIVYLTIDLDVFASDFAPGVSAPSPMGIAPFAALTLLEILKTSGKVISMDVAELNPNFDTDQATARLAARLIYHWVT